MRRFDVGADVDWHIQPASEYIVNTSPFFRRNLLAAAALACTWAAKRVPNLLRPPFQQNPAALPTSSSRRKKWRSRLARQPFPSARSGRGRAAQLGCHQRSGFGHADARCANFQRQPGSTDISIRGTVSTNNTEVGDPAAGFHADGVYLGRPQSAGANFFDLERVEVLRGPQSAELMGMSTVPKSAEPLCTLSQPLTSHLPCS